MKEMPPILMNLIPGADRGHYHVFSTWHLIRGALVDRPLNMPVLTSLTFIPRHYLPCPSSRLATISATPPKSGSGLPARFLQLSLPSHSISIGSGGISRPEALHLTVTAMNGMR